MKLEWFETIMAVAKYGSFSDAAEVIPCSQSSVSRQIKSAENELGVTIFKRSSSSNVVELTDNGKDLMPIIENLLGCYCELREKVRPTGRLRQTPVVLGLDALTFSSSGKGKLMSLLYLSHPEILLTLEEIPSAFRMEQLVTGKVDAVLFLRAFKTGEPIEDTMNDTSLRCVPLGTQHLSIAFGEKYAPENKDGITFPQLKGRSFIFHTDIRRTYDQSSAIRRHALFVQACHDSGFEPDILIVDRHLADIKQVIAVQGNGAFPSTIPSFLREYPGICYIPVIDAPYYVKYYLLSLKSNKNPGISELALFFQECFDKADAKRHNGLC